MRKLKNNKVFPGDFIVERGIESHPHLDVGIGLPPEKRSFSLSTYSAPLYWRLDDPEFNLIEIGVDRDSGMLVSISAVFYKGLLYPLGKIKVAHSNKNAVGIPGFALDLWEDVFKPGRDPLDIKAEFYDVPGRCRFELGEKELRVVLFSDAIRYHITSSDNLVCELNEARELCAVMVTGLDPSEKAILEETIGWSEGR